MEMEHANKQFVLLDRDGTIIKERHYLSDPDNVELLPGAARSLTEMQSMGLGLVVLTNQSGIGRGYFSAETLERIHHRMGEMLAAEGSALDNIYYCPHRPSDGCSCRKPNVGLVEQAVDEFGFDPTRSFVVGDKNCDVEMGRAIGAETFLVRTGYGREVERVGHGADHVADDLRGVVQVLAGRMAGTRP